jgi:hypothetical protein
VLGTQIVDDLRAGGRAVAKHRALGQLGKLVEDGPREAVREHRKRLVQHDAHHLPVARHRIFAGGRFGHPSDGRTRSIRLGYGANGRYSRQPERSQRCQAQRNLPGDITERIAAPIAVGRGVRQLADPDAVEHNDDCSLEWRCHRYDCGK